MKRRILFVDDEPNILKAFQRSLRPLRNVWDMVFESSVDQVLARLGQEEFDVIISDMRMPGMDGGDLLGLVQKKYPKMVRIILSGHADQALAMTTVKTAHQYLAKPCRKETLLATVNRACSLKDLLDKKTLQNVVAAMGTMPSLPALYARIQRALHSDSASIALIGKIISQDMGMTAKVLQLVNSSFFAMPRHVASPAEAAVILGIDVLKTLVLNMEVFSRFKPSTLDILPIARLHEHCINTGVIAREIAQVEKAGKELVDNAMIAGMLHDLGRLILAESFPSEYRRVMKMVKETHTMVHVAESEVMGVSHAEIGGYLLALWGLPDSIVQAVAFHHTPLERVADRFGLCGMIHVSNVIEYYERHMPGKWETLSGLDSEYMERFDLYARVPLWRERLRQRNLRGDR